MSPLPFLLAMEITKLAAILSIAGFFSLPLPPLTVPAAGMFVAFVVARAFRGIRIRRVWPALVQLILLSAAAAWGRGFLHVAICALFWWRALWIERKESGHAFNVARFDEGILLFLGIMALSALTGLGDNGAAKIAPAFVSFAVLTLAVSRNTKKPGTGGAFAAFRAAAATLAAFALSAFALVAALPSLREPVRRAGGAVGRFIVAVIKAILLFLGRLIRPIDTPPPDFRETEARRALDAMERGDPTAFSRVLMWIFAVVVGLALALLVGFILYLVIGHLLGRTEPGAGGTRPGGLKRLLAAIRAAFRGVRDAVSARLAAARNRALEARRPRSAAMKAWIRLLRAAKGAGHRRRAQETPREFAARIASTFPRAAADAPFLAECVELEAYAGMPPDADPDRVRRLRKAGSGLSRAAFMKESVSRGLGALYSLRRSP